MSPLSVTFVTTSFIRSATDYYSYFIYEQADSVTQILSDIEVNVVAPHAPGYRFKEKIGRITAIRYPYFFPLSKQQLAYQTDGIFKTIRRSPLALISLPFFLLNMLLTTAWYGRKSQIIHAQWIPTAFVLLPLKLFGKKIVVSVRGSDLHSLRSGSPTVKAIYKFLLNRLDMLLPVSKDFVKALSEELQVSTPIQPLFNGVNDNFFKNHEKAAAKRTMGLDETKKYILFVGNILTSKGVDTLLDAFKEVHRNYPHVHLLMAGEGPELTKYQAVAESYGLKNFVHFLDLVPREKVPSIMSACEFLVLPSRGEGRPNVVLEAMACGLPVIATNAGGTKELVFHEKTGLIFNPGDTVVLKNHLERLLSDGALCATLTQQAKTFLKDEALTWSTHGKKLSECYKRVLKEKSCAE